MKLSERIRRAHVSTIKLGVALALIAGASILLGCCSVSRIGSSVAFGDQTNIVIWNEQTHTEHFVRLATFVARGPDFGFIAPSPNKPELASASKDAFKTLQRLEPAPKGFWGEELRAANVGAGRVDVVQEVDVAGYHATTLLAKDAQALAVWMKANGYQSTPGVVAWTKPYIAKGWYLTAFKVNNRAAQIASTGTIRMSFKTDRPFNPYFVPADNIAKDSQSVLKVYFVADGDYDAHIGDSQPWQPAQWRAPVPPATGDLLAKQLNLRAGSIPDGMQVEEFRDPQFPRPASDDIYFTRHTNFVPWTVALIVAALGIAAIKRFTRSASTNA
jgi:hypothetical protein